MVFGQGRALNAGTALLVLGHQTVLDAPSPHREAALRLLVRTCADMLTGRALDLAFEPQRLNVTVEESMAMTRGKTATLLSCATSIGAVLVAGETEVSRLLHDFGQQVGIAFQARDDLLGIWGRPDDRWPAGRLRPDRGQRHAADRGRAAGRWPSLGRAARDPRRRRLRPRRRPGAGRPGRGAGRRGRRPRLDRGPGPPLRRRRGEDRWRADRPPRGPGRPGRGGPHGPARRRLSR